MDIEQKLNECYEEILRNNWFEDCETIDDVKEIMIEEWGEGADRGYAIFNDDHYTNDYLFECINRIDEYEIYDSDYSAAEQAELDGGIKIIRDLKFPPNSNASVLNGTIIDTPKNRQQLVKCLAEKAYD